MLLAVASSAHSVGRRSWTISSHSMFLISVVLRVLWVAALRSFSSDNLGQVDSSRRFSNVFDRSKIRSWRIHRLLGLETSCICIFVLSLVRKLLVRDLCRVTLLVQIGIRASGIHQLRASMWFSIAFSIRYDASLSRYGVGVLSEAILEWWLLVRFWCCQLVTNEILCDHHRRCSPPCRRWSCLFITPDCKISIRLWFVIQELNLLLGQTLLELSGLALNQFS